MARKQPEVTEQTKANLRQAFWQLYESKPLQKISVKQITDLAGYNRGTFYLYFDDIRDLLGDIEEKVLMIIGGMMEGLASGADQGLASAITEGEPGRQAHAELGSIMVPLAQAVRTYGKYARVLLSDRGDPAFKARFKQMVWPVVKRSVLGTRVLDPREERVVREFCLAGLIAAITAWLEEDDQLPIESFIPLLTDELLGRPVAGAAQDAADATAASRQLPLR